MKVKMSSMCWQENWQVLPPKNSWNLSEGGGDSPRTLWIICYRKTWRLVFEVHSSILITTSDHIILNEPAILMGGLIFAKTKSLLNKRTHEIHGNQFSRKSIFFRYSFLLSKDTIVLCDGSIWDTIKKEKIGTFVSNNKIAIVTVNQQIIVIKEERKLMIRLLVAFRTRADTDLQFCLGKYEFCHSFV